MDARASRIERQPVKQEGYNWQVMGGGPSKFDALLGLFDHDPKLLCDGPRFIHIHTGSGRTGRGSNTPPEHLYAFVEGIELMTEGGYTLLLEERGIPVHNPRRQLRLEAYLFRSGSGRLRTAPHPKLPFDDLYKGDRLALSHTFTRLDLLLAFALADRGKTGLLHRFKTELSALEWIPERAEADRGSLVFGLHLTALYYSTISDVWFFKATDRSDSPFFGRLDKDAGWIAPGDWWR